MNDIAFLAMDLCDHHLPQLAHRLLNVYLEATGDYAGVRVLRYYLVYRALVRAKVSCLRAHQPGIAAPEKSSAEDELSRHLRLAERLAATAHPALVIMHGMSGSGKSTIARSLAQALGAVSLRSDVERKRLHGLGAQARSGSGLDAGLYAPSENERTYARLADHARALLAARYPVIVDAAFLKRAQRNRFAELARDAGANFAIASCTAPVATLRSRVALRACDARDASEAGLVVLERQLATAEALSEAEAAHAIRIDAQRNAGAIDAAALAQRLGLKLEAF